MATGTLSKVYALHWYSSLSSIIQAQMENKEAQSERECLNTDGRRRMKRII